MSAADTQEQVVGGRPSNPPPATPRPGLKSPGRPGRRRRRSLPYLLIAPALLIIVAVLGYPLVDTLVLSFQDERRNNLWMHTSPPWVGFDQYTSVFGDSVFWEVVLRTVVFVSVCVVATMVLGLLIALLMMRISSWVRITLSVVMIAVWAMPVLVGASVFKFMFDSDYGLVDQLLTRLPGMDYTGHNWFLNPVTGMAIVVLLVVWGAIPFISISLHAALTQVPQELEEAARIDGASGFGIFRYVTFPVIKPVFVMTSTLSVIWDFGVLVQILLMRGGHPEQDYQLLGLYSYTQAFTVNSFSRGAAIAVVNVLLLAGVAIYYLRQLLKIGEVE